MAARSALVLMGLVAAVALSSKTTGAFLFPTPTASTRPSTRLASSYDDMDYTAQRNQVQEKYVYGLESKRGMGGNQGATSFESCCWSLALVLSHSASLFSPLFPPLPLSSYRPDWAGGGVVSSLVSALINNKFLYGFMKIGARKVGLDGGGGRDEEREKG